MGIKEINYLTALADKHYGLRKENKVYLLYLFDLCWARKYGESYTGLNYIKYYDEIKVDKKRKNNTEEVMEILGRLMFFNDDNLKMLAIKTDNYQEAENLSEIKLK